MIESGEDGGTTMGLLIDGVWHEQEPAKPDAARTEAAKAGRFERQDSAFRNWVTSDGRPGPTGSDGRIDQRNMIVWLYEDHGCARTYQNEPVLNINPKGWVDCYRFPKYAYYLWQANHVSEPMIFVHPHFCPLCPGRET